jgi:hypothetical protein
MIELPHDLRNSIRESKAHESTAENGCAAIRAGLALLEYASVMFPG